MYLRTNTTCRRPDIASGILVAGGTLYAFLCFPAIGRRGDPTIDPFWMGVTHLWVGPIALSALFDSAHFRSRYIHLALYAAVTAFFDGGTVGGVTPRHVTMPFMFFCMFLFLPSHLVVTLLVEGMMQLLLRPARTLTAASNEARGVPQISLYALLVGFTIVCVTVGFPFVYRSQVLRAEQRNAIAAADEDWRIRDAVIYHDFDDDYVECNQAVVQFAVDREPGIPYEGWHVRRRTSDAYNARIAELIRENGLPPWSLKTLVPSAEEVAASLDSTDFQKVDSFPCDVTPGITLMRRGTVYRGGGSTTSSTDSLSIVTDKGTCRSGLGVLPVHLRIQGDLVYIRNGPNWVGVFHQDGRSIAEASRKPAP